VNQATMALSPPPCDPASGKSPASAALSNPVLYRQLIDAMSMRYWQYSGQNGHDHFFDAFGKFGGASFGQMLAQVSSRAARGRVSSGSLKRSSRALRLSADRIGGIPIESNDEEFVVRPLGGSSRPRPIFHFPFDICHCLILFNNK
jgi:hypothetical protein